MENFGKNLVFWLAIGLMLAFLFNVFQTAQKTDPASGALEVVAYSDFMADAKSLWQQWAVSTGRA